MATLSMYRGDTTKYRFTVFALDEDFNQVAFDLTDCTVFFTAKVDKNDVDARAVIATDSNSNIDIDDPTNGRFILTIIPSDTSSFIMDSDTEVLYYDVQVKAGSSDIYTVDSGTLTISKDVTIRTA